MWIFYPDAELLLSFFRIGAEKAERFTDLVLIQHCISALFVIE